MSDWAAKHYQSAEEYLDEALVDMTDDGRRPVGESGKLDGFAQIRLILAGIHYQAAAVPDQVAARAAWLAAEDGQGTPP